jgi:hypothetical protein
VRRPFALWLALLAAYATTLGLAGDATTRSSYSAPEAHRLLSAASIAQDGSIDLTDEYRERAWADWYPGELRPTARPVGGRLAEPQGLGLPLLLAPAYALGGPTLVELWCAGFMALAVVLAVRLARHVVPDPWATGGALAVGLSPPVLVGATTVGPAGPGAALLAGGMLLALAVREQPRVGWTLGCALCVAVLPWLGVSLLFPGAVVALLLARWLRRRQRALAGFVGLEVVLTSAVVFITVNDRVFGGLLPTAAARARGRRRAWRCRATSWSACPGWPASSSTGTSASCAGRPWSRSASSASACSCARAAPASAASPQARATRRRRPRA